MYLYHWIFWLHLVAAATWTGGIIVLAALIVALRRAGVERSLLQTVARQFGRVSWTAMIVAVTTGLAQLYLLGLPWTLHSVLWKLGLVIGVICLAVIHTWTARHTSPRVRGIFQLLILIASLAIFRVAVTL